MTKQNNLDLQRLHPREQLKWRDCITCQLVWGAVTLHRVIGTNRFQYVNYPRWIFYKSINHLWLSIQSYHCDARSACQSKNTAICYLAFLGHHENEGWSLYVLKCRCTRNTFFLFWQCCCGCCQGQHFKDARGNLGFPLRTSLFSTSYSKESQFSVKWRNSTSETESKVAVRIQAFSACFENGASSQTPCCRPSHSRKRGRRKDEWVFIFC